MIPLKSTATILGPAQTRYAEARALWSEAARTEETLRIRKDEAKRVLDAMKEQESRRCKCEWCGTEFYRKPGAGRKPRFCRDFCRVARFRSDRGGQI